MRNDSGRKILGKKNARKRDELPFALIFCLRNVTLLCDFHLFLSILIHHSDLAEYLTTINFYCEDFSVKNLTQTPEKNPRKRCKENYRRKKSLP
jgi:hypothetical protein